MQSRTNTAPKRAHTYNTDTVESLKSTHSGNMAKTAARAMGDIGSGIGKGLLDTFLGTDNANPEQHSN
ncbi:MAG: hypothetical protein ABIO02_00950, partial [Patescibacteria group bacterium]